MSSSSTLKGTVNGVRFVTEIACILFDGPSTKKSKLFGKMPYLDWGIHNNVWTNVLSFSIISTFSRINLKGSTQELILNSFIFDQKDRPIRNLSTVSFRTTIFNLKCRKNRLHARRNMRLFSRWFSTSALRLLFFTISTLWMFFNICPNKQQTAEPLSMQVPRNYRKKYCREIYRFLFKVKFAGSSLFFCIYWQKLEINKQ